MDNVLDRVIEEVKAAERDSKIDLDSANWKVRGGLAMRKRQGEENLPRLQEKYCSVVKPRAFAIFATGPFAEQFAMIAQTEGDVVVARADTVYRKLAKDVWDSMSHRAGEFTSNESAALLTSLRHLGVDLGLTSLSVVRTPGSHHIASEEALVSFLRDTIRASGNGDDLNRLCIEQEAAKAALAIRYNNAVVPVIVLASTKAEREAFKASKSLFGGTTFVINIDEEPTVESVGKELAAVSKKLKAIRSKE